MIKSGVTSIGEYAFNECSALQRVNYAGSAKFLACDVNHDGKITAVDARLILRAAVGLATLT